MKKYTKKIIVTFPNDNWQNAKWNRTSPNSISIREEDMGVGASDEPLLRKFLFKPLDNMQVTQHFGENNACMPINGGAVINCNGLNPPKGYKSVYSGMIAHNGTDLYAPRFTPIFASQDGVVEEYVAEEARGLGLGIITDRKYYCDEVGKDVYWKIRYWHNHTNLVKKGDKVKIGQIIALADNTGYSSGDHLHWEGKPVEVKFNKDGSIKRVDNILQDNGYYGAINLYPYLLDQKASDYTKYKSWQERLVITLMKYLK